MMPMDERAVQFTKRTLRKGFWVILGLHVLFAWPFFARYTPIYTPLAMEILIFALFGAAFNLALGYTGLFSLGHAAFFGVGCYVTGGMLKFFSLPLELSMAAGVLASTAVGALMGFICLRKSGVYFAMVTLAVSQVFYYIAQMWISVTGGHEGMSNIPSLKLLIGVNLTKSLVAKYWFVAGVIAIALYALWRIVNSSFGRVLQAVRENEERARTCGYDTGRVKYVSFILSAGFSGLAGALYLVFLELAGIETIAWVMSGNVMILTLFGGTGFFLGPLVGSIVFLMMKDILSRVLENWQIVTGVIFILIVLFLPQGILGSMVDFFRERALRRQGGSR